VTMARRLVRPLGVAVTAVLLAIAAAEFVWFWRYIDSQHALGVDLNYYREIAQRWMDTGVWYTDRQIAGPYETQTLVDNLYPPHALYLFLPWVVQPLFPLWWLLPFGMLAYVIWRLRPRPWFWLVFALILALPKTPVAILYGNSDLWVLFFASAAVLWSWPGVLVTFKPSMGPFALVGIHRRSWWVAAAILAIATLPQIQLWLLWPRVIEHSSATLEYSLAAYPLMTLPWVARLASTTRPPVRLPSRLGRFVPRSTTARP
jgi:hypothetical protein